MGSETDQAGDGNGEAGPGPNEALARRYACRVRILARQHLAPDQVEPVVEETLRRVAVAVGEGRAQNPSGLGPLVYETALRLIAVERGPAAPDLLEMPVRPEEREASARALEALDEEDRRILYLAFRRGLGPAEIAVVLGTTLAEAVERKRAALERFVERFEASR